MATARRFAAAAVAMVLLGLGLGWQPLSARGIECGSTFYRSSADGAACDRTLADRRPVVFVLLAGGIGAWAVRTLTTASPGQRRLGPDQA